MVMIEYVTKVGTTRPACPALKFNNECGTTCAVTRQRTCCDYCTHERRGAPSCNICTASQKGGGTRAILTEVSRND